MIVLVGAVFATDELPAAANGATQINIKATIEVVAPRFSLATNDSTDLVADKPAAIVANKTASNITVQETATMKDSVAAALGNGTAQTISFVIKQTRDSRINTAYHLTVTATDLKKDGTSTTAHEFFTCSTLLESDDFLPRVKTQLTLTTPSPAGTGISAVTDGAETPTTLATFAPLSSGSNTLVATYAGGFVDISEKLTNDVIGSFDVSWTGDALAAAGTYTATVILEVTAAT